MSELHAVIPAGGAGTRLWPLSRAARPKFLLDLTGSGRTLLQQTWDRLTTFIDPANIHIVTGQVHAEAVREQLPDLADLIIEPSPRDSMPAIGLAAAIIATRHSDAVIASFAADHVISDIAGFAETVKQAVIAAESGLVATIGIAPSTPSTGFGYIEAGENLHLPGAPDAKAVVKFVEKPDRATAAQYLEHGGFSWNAGMFVTRADVLLAHLARLQPGLHAGLERIADSWITAHRDEVLAETWPTLTKIAIDHAIAEPVSHEGGIGVVAGAFDWDDVGDFAAVAGLHAGSEAVWVDADGYAYADDGTLIAVVGIRNAVVVKTRDAILVTALEHAQSVKQVPAILRETRRSHLT